MKQQLTKCEDIEAMSELYAQVREDFKRVVSEAMKGKHHSAETKKKISEAQKGNQYAKGKPKSEEHKRKLSEAHKGKKGKTPWNKGKKLSEETKNRIGEARRGKHCHIGSDGKRHYS